MPLLRSIARGIHLLAVNDRHTRLFENLWPIPEGISYNAYLVEGDEVALVDAAKDILATDLLAAVRNYLDGRPLSYLVVNHLEPDHSGALRVLREMFPDVEIVSTAKAAEFLEHLYGLVERVRVVGEGDELDLGGRTLRFVSTPMVHWPETMMTYDGAEGVLFSGDAFGGYGAPEGAVFDDQVHDRHTLESEMLRYFANVIGKYAPMVLKALDKVRELPIRIVAPAHGILWREAPRRPLELSERWSRYEGVPGVTVAYASMYGNGARLVETLEAALVDHGITDVRVHDVSRSHVSYVLRDVWETKGVALGTPTYNLGPFPTLDAVTRLLENKRLQKRFLGVFGTYGWSGGGVKALVEFGERMGWTLVDPVVEARFSPGEEDLVACARLGEALAGAVGRSQEPVTGDS